MSYRADGRKVFKEAVETKNEDGSTSISIGFPVLEVWEHLTEPVKFAEHVAKVLSEKETKMTDKMPDEILALKKDKPDQPPDGVCLMHGEVRGWNWAIDHLYDRGLIHSDTKYKALQERCERLESLLTQASEQLSKCLDDLWDEERAYLSKPKFRELRDTEFLTLREICEVLNEDPTNNKRGE